MTVKFKTTAGLHDVGVTFPQTNFAPVLDLDQHFQRDTLQTGPTPGFTFFPHVGSVRVEGPFNATTAKDSPSRRKIFICRPTSAADETACARRIVTRLVTHAYRHPAATGEVDQLMAFFQDGRKEAGGFDAGIEMVLARVLASPKFIYRIETEPATAKLNQPYRISDLDLASRLSFFLWSRSPDDQLLTLAAQNRLHDPIVLERQVRRMLKDPRAEALAVNFAGQWLNLRGLGSSGPLPMIYPDFDDPLRQAMRREVELLFDDIVRQDRNVVDLLTANYTFVNERLAKHYGIPNIYGSQFRRITLRSRDGRSLGTDREGRVPGDDVEAGTHVAGRPRQVDHGEHPRDEPAGSAAERAGAAAARRRRHGECARADDAAEDAGPSGAGRLHPMPQHDGPDRVLARAV